MKDTANLHKKVQEHCDCYASADPLKEMSELAKHSDQPDAAIKWLALAALHGVNANAKRISISMDADGHVDVTAKYRKTDLPAPDAQTGKDIFESVAEIFHLEGDKAKLPLALGIRDDSIELDVKVKRENNAAKVTLNFP